MKMLVSLFLIMFVLMLNSCGNNPTNEENPELNPPSNPSVEDNCGNFTLTWTLSAHDSESDFAGYKIFRDTESLKDLDLEALLSGGFLVDSVGPGIDTFTDSWGTGLSNLDNYFYQVRAFNEDKKYSTGANTTSPTTKRVAVRTGIVYENNSDQGSYFILFSNETVTKDRAPESDFALNTSADPLFKSAHLASGGGQRKTKITLIKNNASIADFTNTDEVTINNNYDLFVHYHDLLALYSENSDNYVKLWITSGDADSPFIGTSPDKYIEFQYDYQSLEGCNKF